MFCLPIWILIVAYIAHIMEEYFLNWRDWTEKVSKLQLSWSEFLVTNAAVIVMGFPIGLQVVKAMTSVDGH